jgi:hypothetical protein
MTVETAEEILREIAREFIYAAGADLATFL